MPGDVRSELCAPRNDNVALVICKGDLMYRKLLGDRSWNTEESFADVVSYFPSPVVALRTCKSPLAIGMKVLAFILCARSGRSLGACASSVVLLPDLLSPLQLGQDREVAEKSPQWMVNGEYGMVQVCWIVLMHLYDNLQCPLVPACVSGALRYLPCSQFSAPPPVPSVTMSGDGFQVEYDASVVESQWNALVQ